MATTSTSTVKAFHSVAVTQVKARCPITVWVLGASRRRSPDTTVLVPRTDLLHGTRSPERVGRVLPLGLVNTVRAPTPPPVPQTVKLEAGIIPPLLLLKARCCCTRKLKSDKISARSENSKCPSCIVHAIDIRDYGSLTSFRNVRGNPDEKFAYLHEIREIRMAEPLNSPRRMEAVCAQIPETLEGVDLEMIGYPRPCYQRFTAN
ncbi:hypothetical protein GWK47_024777 [Chionoecetes opilio]|uniref:Uncharacterized protein n=1 Tax=Chionoecetes opilio TaxID=41210 RepID=A0A8J4XV73_CHIOP|nr:hypothetical protein GWK47_024777 [Chionoecetes opilio]